MNELQKKYLKEYLAQHPEVKAGKKKKELTWEEKQNLADRRPESRDRAGNRRRDW